MAAQHTAPRLLLVDDDRSIRESLQVLLELEGYAVDTAENGHVGLQRLRTDPAPTLILLDLWMPVMDGAQFRREQLADPQLARIPVVVCSAVPADAIRTHELQAVAYLRKPLNIDALLSTLRTVTQSQ